MPRLLPPRLVLGAALLALASLSRPLGAAGETPGAEAPSALLGRPVAALLDLPGVALSLRMAGGGWQHALAEAVRQPGPPLRLAEDRRHLYGWGCAPAVGCGEAGVFLAWDPKGEQVFAVLVERGRPVLFVPPRAGRSWPAVLAGPMREFDAGAAGLIRFGR